MKSNVQTDIHELVAQMTLEEKASLCSGLDFWLKPHLVPEHLFRFETNGGMNGQF